MDPMARGAAESFHTPQPIVEVLTFEDERVNRYVWYPGEDLPWPEIAGGFIKRCRVTPIVPFPIWERIADVPEDMRKAVRRDWMDRSHQEAQYEIRPQGIFEAVMGQYGVLGVRELTALTGMEEQRVAALNIDTTFAPWPSSDIPKPYSAIEDHIKQTLRSLNGNQVLRAVGEEMLASIAAARAYDVMFVDEEESRKELKYSRPGLRALSRLERERRDQALNNMAASQNKVFAKIPDILAGQGGVDPAVMEIIKGQQEANALLREQLAQQGEALRALLSERQEAKPARSRKTAEVDA